MALVAERLSVADLEARYEACEDVTSSRRFQTIFLLAKGHLSTPEEKCSTGASKKAPDIGGLLAFGGSFLRSAVRWRFGLGPTGPALALGEPEAIAVHFEDMDVMRETVEERAGQPLGDEHRCPFVEWEIAGDDRRAAFISLTEDLEQQFCAGWRRRDVAEFVDDQQLVGGELPLEPQEPLFITRFQKFVDAIVIMLRSLKMHGMAQAVGELTEQGAPAFEAALPILSQLLKAETADREVRSTAYQLKAARFPNYRDLAGFDFASSEVNEALVRQLHRCEFLEDAHNAVLVGDPGTGKTHLATAIGVQAIEHHRKRVRFFSTVDLVNALEQEKLQGRSGQIAGRLAHSDLVILDELGYLAAIAKQSSAAFSASGGALLFHLLSKLYERTSVIITTNLSFGEWAGVFGEQSVS